MIDILSYNQRLVEPGEHEKYFTNKYPGRGLAILSCIDAHTIKLLPNVLDLKDGDVKFIRNTGVLVIRPWGSVMRSSLVAVFELKVREAMAIVYRDRGMRGLHAEEFFRHVHDSNTSDDRTETLHSVGIDLDGWLADFDDTEDSMCHIVELIRKHLLVPDSIVIHGLVIHPATGKFNLITGGSLPASDG